VTHAIVLIEAERGAMPALGAQIADTDGVAECYSVTGSWDFVAIVRVRAHDQLASVIKSGIGELQGVLRTQTMVAFEVFSQHDLDAMFAVGE
jgi:DNA-binding Lrp family transcriptional regulator